MSIYSSIKSRIKLISESVMNEVEFQNKKNKNTVIESSTLNLESILNQNATFFLSTGRSGTKFITEILRHSDNAFVQHNPFPELSHQSSLIYKNAVDIESLKWAFLHARLDFLTKAKKANIIYIETNNRITLYAPAIAELMPNAKFIHIIRHPGEFVRSGMRRGYYQTMPSELSGHLIPKKNDSIFEQWNSLSLLEKISWQWNEINSEIENFKEKIPKSRIMTVKSNDLFESLEVVEELIRFIDIKPIKKDILKHKHKGKVNTQINGSYPEYELWSEEEQMSLKKWTSAIATKYNFI